MIGSGVERLNKEFGNLVVNQLKKPERSRHCISERLCIYVIGLEKSEKAQKSYDLEPGELPD